MKRKLLIGVLLAAAAAVIVAPFLKADHHRARMQQAM